jgi:hypothetical protein
VKVNTNFLDETILVGIQTFITFLNGQKMAVGINRWAALLELKKHFICISDDPLCDLSGDLLIVPQNQALLLPDLFFSQLLLIHHQSVHLTEN